VSRSSSKRPSSRPTAKGLRDFLRGFYALLRSRLFPDRVRITLSPNEIKLVRLTNGRKPRELARKQLEGPGGSDWRPVVASLAEVLRETTWHKAEASVELSNHYVRYVRVPWVEDLTSESERLAYAHHCFTQLFGPRIGQWAVRLSDDRYNAAQVASAIEPELMDALSVAMAGASLKLVSLKPGFMNAFNQCRHALSTDPCWFVHVEPGRACLARIENGEWTGVRTTRLGTDWTSDLSVILSREQLTHAGPIRDSKIYVYAPSYTPTLISGEWLTAQGLQLQAFKVAAPVGNGVIVEGTVS